MCRLHIIALILTLAVLAGPAAAQSAGGAEGGLEVQVDQAVQKASAYLWGRHQGDHWEEKVMDAVPREYGGRSALCAYALLAAGESYQSKRMGDTLKWLAQADMTGVYARSFRACAFAQLPVEAAGQTLSGDLLWLLKAMNPDGAFGYEPLTDGQDAWDNSNSQMAVLAVWSAAERGLDVPAEFWKRVERHWLTMQTGPGGWSYLGSNGKAYGSMSAAGLASLFVCFDAIHREEFLRCKADTKYPPIERGLEWMAQNFSPLQNPGKGPQYFYYYLYAVERVGLASGYKYFGTHNWYREGAAELLRTQAPDGSWGNESDTALALLFLARGRHPVLFNKLRYEGSWNTRPRDLANLTRWISRTFEKPVYWQVLDVASPQEQWSDAPILYISGATPPTFSADDIAKLRAYALKGGLIVSEAACNSPAFTLAMRQAYGKIFPGLELTRLPEDHPIYTARGQPAGPGGLMGVSNGVRLLAIHSSSDLSKAWQLDASVAQRATFELAANVYLHATDSLSLARRGARAWPTLTNAKPTMMIPVALLTHAGNPNPEPLAYERLAILMANRCGVRLQFSEPMPIAKLAPQQYAVALMTGTGAFTLSEADKTALRKFVTGGGTLIADAAGGSEEFDKAVRAELLPLLPAAQVGSLGLTSEIYNQPGLVIDKVSYRRAAQAKYGQDATPHLEAVAVGNRPLILYSRDDITASLVGYPGQNLRGYTSASAFALMRNLLLYAAARSPATQPAREGTVEVQWSE